MRLAEFIETHIEPIVAEWEAFARTIGPGGGMTNLALRDHAEDILRAAVRDMQSPQTVRERSQKSHGHGAPGGASRRLDSASSVHGVDRVASGFDLLEVVSEYRALRASVLQLWRASEPHPDVNDIDDITRFNESIDQSLTEAVRSFTKRVEQSRQMFLAILAHDLRNPLNCIMMSAQAASQSEASEDVAQISASAQVIARLITELIDFAGTGMGGTLPVARPRWTWGRCAGKCAASYRPLIPAASSTSKTPVTLPACGMPAGCARCSPIC
jgi:signal transduction histidine kinase